MHRMIGMDSSPRDLAGVYGPPCILRPTCGAFDPSRSGMDSVLESGTDCACKVSKSHTGLRRALFPLKWYPSYSSPFVLYYAYETFLVLELESGITRFHGQLLQEKMKSPQEDMYCIV